ncbi:hypothetical protein CAPTEDRAFT_202741 [Capitella teleta]|uniref:Uncharacterized protein n=1 Tax=Capitella teleta TaxID=283909 RepID=R7T558_CAPTE|nr:hypothetical protein CAPTEDRAFT_202741 [Capitella teleta]|eukprot:ELT88106.1 hypothetical protein CAPTEDRAFT_202741 [Capitella teleta]
MLWLVPCLAAVIVGCTEGHDDRSDQNTEICAMFGTHRDDVYVTEKPLFLELGRQDVLDTFSVEMDVIAPPDDFNGNLFAVGSKRDFPYYERQWVAELTQFLVVEIFYSSDFLVKLKSVLTWQNAKN